ncbi:MAG: FumA C-terminus/TtdB family hydratase beta subunit [Thermotogota bacterium]
MKNNLAAGQFIEYTGEMIIMRDAAHKKIYDFYNENKKIPIDFKNKIIFYAGPAKKPENEIIGSIGPTTSKRMDDYLEIMYKLGIKSTIGKGNRSDFVSVLNKQYKRNYFICPSGAAAALSTKILKYEIIAFEELGAEAIQRIEVKDFPLIVAIDEKGNNLYNISN